MGYNYSFKNFDKEHMAKAVGRDLGISTKHSIEICNFIRGKNLQKAKEILQRVVKKKQAVPFKRFNKNVGHRKAIGPGRYPVKASQNILKLLESAEINAQQRGLNTANLTIRHICSQKASTPMHYGRIRRIRMKRTHVEVVLEEQAKKEQKPAKAEEKKEVGTEKKAGAAEKK